MSTNNKEARTQTRLAEFAAESDLFDEAVAIAEDIYLSKDMGDSVMITTAEGNVVINTGFPGFGETHKSRFRKINDESIRYIVLTQCHANQIGGAEDMRDADTQVVVQRNFDECRQYWRILHEFYARRSNKLWGDVLGKRGKIKPGMIREVAADITFDRHHCLELGGKRFELYAVPGGESLDALVVWLPQQKVLLSGNLFGPVFGNLPNLYTIRGDKIRSASRFIESLALVRKLAPETIITGHEIIEGNAEIDARLEQLGNAVRYIHDQTVEGMNRGKTVFDLMADIKLPPALAVGQAHGKIQWCVRAIWEEYAGWFHYDSTTSLYEVPRSRVSRDFVELAGGIEALATRASEHLAEGRPLEALHLIETALQVDPDSRVATEVAIQAHRMLLERSGVENFSEVKWLESEVERFESNLDGGGDA